MPCDSRIETKMTEGARLVEAMKALGYDMLNEGEFVVVGRKDGAVVGFEKSRGTGAAFTTTAYGNRLDAIGKKYAEIGVRSFALRRGYSIVESDGTKMTLRSRRG